MTRTTKVPTRTVGPETFHLAGSFRFDVTAAKAIVADGRPSEEVETDRLTPVLGHLGCWPDQAAALPDAALDEPLILATTEKGKPQIIDGLHRIHAAETRGRPTLNVVRLNRDESIQIQYGEDIL